MPSHKVPAINRYSGNKATLLSPGWDPGLCQHPETCCYLFTKEEVGEEMASVRRRQSHTTTRWKSGASYRRNQCYLIECPLAPLHCLSTEHRLRHPLACTRGVSGPGDLAGGYTASRRGAEAGFLFLPPTPRPRHVAWRRQKSEGLGRGSAAPAGTCGEPPASGC